MAFVPIACPGGGGGSGDSADVELTILCDVDAAGVRVGTVIMVQEYDADGVAVGAPVPTDPATGLPYVVVGTLLPCEEAGADVELEILCDVQPDNTFVLFLRHYVHNTATGALIAAETFDTLPDGSVYAPTGTVGSCEPYRLCTPSSDLDLVGECGPGETPNTVLIGAEGVASDSVVNDDPSADPLCGGVWDRPSEASPFTVLETFRNATYDQPGPVTQGTAPYAGLTASPGWTGSNVDTPGQGWLQTSDINSFTNGIWQVPNPFSTADGMTAKVTFASHDGTQTPNGDGMAFVFTDGGVPPQGTAIGGGGNLGLFNWAGGYVAIVLDEYGGSCTCGSGVNPGGCGFCTNTISIQLAGTARSTALCACCVIATASVAPHNISADTDRPNPAQLITSIIEEGGQTYVSASILWAGDTDPVVYFDRVNVTACAGPSPATLRMALYGGSGGAFRSEHEYRDATATAAGSQQWRAFPIQTDPIPPCVTSVRVEACVDVTMTEDTQTVGNGNPETFLWLVNTATNTVLDKAQRSSQPSQVGTANTMCVDAVVPVAQLANLRVYVGAETRDTFGIYGSSWENLEITVAGLGCPVQPVRTLAISAPCPIDVNIVGGTADGTPAPVTVVNTPSSFEDAPVCVTVAGVTSTGFRRELRAPDGTVTVTFLGTDGLPVTPDTWRPGPCASGDTELLTLCDLGTDPPTPFVRRNTYDGAGAVVSSADLDYAGAPYVLVGAAGPCPECGPTVLGNVCITSSDFPGVVLPAVAVQACDGTMTYLNAATGIPWPNQTAVVICPPGNQTWEEILCDSGAGAVRFRRIYNLTALGSVVFYDEDLDANAYVVVGPATVCGSGGSTVIQEMCDRINISTTTQFFRRTSYDAEGNLIAFGDFDVDGVPYVTAGEVRLGHCDPNQFSHEILCDQPSGVRFMRRWIYTGFDADPAGFNDYTLDGITTYVVAGTAGACPTAGNDIEAEVLCDANGTQFLRRYLYDSATGNLLGFVDRDLNGVVFAPVDPVNLCRDRRDAELEILCDANSTQFVRAYSYDPTTGAFLGFVDRDLNGVGFAPVDPVGICRDRQDLETQIICDANGIPFLRRYSYDVATGGYLGFVDRDLNGLPYVPAEPVNTCAGGACTNATTLLVCDLPTGDPDGIPTVTNSNQQFIADTANADFIQRVGGGGALWTGGVINLGPDVSPGPGPITQIHRWVAATLQAVPPSCTDGMVHLSLSVQALNIGPAAGCSGAGRFRLYRVSDGAVLASGSPLINTPAGDSVTLTIEADVAVAELNTGNVAVWLDTETWQTGTCAPPDSKTWQASNFTAAYSYGQDGCATQFLRTVVTDCETGATVATVDTTPAGAPYVVTGVVGQCSTAGSSSGSSCPCVSASDIGQAVADAMGEDVTRDSESFILCSSTPAPGTQFIRTRVYDETGAITATVDTTLTGAAFVPGVVSVCSQAVVTDFDFVVLQVCDSASPPVAFLRRLTFASATGLVTSTTDTTYAGAAYVPVGAVGPCSDCCPTILSEGCTNTGSGRYVAIRLSNGTINLIDAVTGAAILAANVVSCPGDAIFTLSAEGRLLTAAQVWTPGADVVGTLTGLTFTVLTGTASYLDASGTAVGPLPAGFTASWNLSQDGNVLTPPQSITAAAASTVHVGWTRR